MHIFFYPIVWLCKGLTWVFGILSSLFGAIEDFFDTLDYDLSYPIDKHKGKKEGYEIYRNHKKHGFFFR